MRLKNRRLAASVIATLLFLVFSCAPPVKKPEETAKLPAEQQDTLAWAEYEDILNMTTEKGKRNVLPQLEKSYMNVIARYPDTKLAQESYWRLIMLNLEDFNPSRPDRADALRKEFVEKYPASNMIDVIDDSMSRFYYRNQIWDRLLDVTARYTRKYIETQKLDMPLFLFFYSEAKFNLNDFKEAEKGYKIIIRNLPQSTEASVARKRLEKIQLGK